MKASEYLDIGQYLRDSRDSLHITIEQAAAALHIRAKYLKAIEHGNLDGLPGKAYIRGYIKNYADYLGLKSKEVVEAYESLPALKSSEFFIPEPTLRQNLPSRIIVWGALIGLFLLYGYGYLTLHNHALPDHSVPEVPEQLLQLLDKSPHVTMDKAWVDCLNSGNAVCFVTLCAQVVMPNSRELYDINGQNNAAPK